MFRSVLTLVDRIPLGRWCALATLFVCLGTWGCTTLDLRGESFAENDLSSWAQQMRHADDQGPSTAYSNKARQIDRSLGGSRDIARGSRF